MLVLLSQTRPSLLILLMASYVSLHAISDVVVVNDVTVFIVPYPDVADYGHDKQVEQGQDDKE